MRIMKLTPAEKAQLAKDVAAFLREGREFLDKAVGPRKAEQPSLFKDNTRESSDEQKN